MNELTFTGFLFDVIKRIDERGERWLADDFMSLPAQRRAST
ncbi:hypothetical protein [Streptosporangium sandarakinum]